MTPVINNSLTMTRSIKVAAFLLALVFIERTWAASISTPMPYFNRMYGYFADFNSPDLEDLHGVNYNCTDYRYMYTELPRLKLLGERAGNPGAGLSYNIRFSSISHPRTIEVEYYGGDLNGAFTNQLAVHRTSGELGYHFSQEHRNVVHTYRVSDDARFLLVERAGKWKTHKSFRKFVNLMNMPIVASQVYPDYMLLSYFVCKRASPF